MNRCGNELGMQLQYYEIKYQDTFPTSDKISFFKNQEVE